MSLRLSEADQTAYNTDCKLLNMQLQQAQIFKNEPLRKKIKQQLNQLYILYQGRELPPPPKTQYEIEMENEDALTLEERIKRIERHLKIGFWYEHPDNT